MVVFENSSADFAVLALTIAIFIYAYTRSKQGTNQTKKTTETKEKEEKPSQNTKSEEDNHTIGPTDETENINHDKLQQLQNDFNGLLDQYDDLLNTYDDLTDNLIEQLEDKLAADAGYWKTTSIDFDWDTYENTIDTLDDIERRCIQQVERFNSTDGWQGTQHESQIKDLLLRFEDRYEQRKEIRDRIEGHLKTIYA